MGLAVGVILVGCGGHDPAEVPRLAFNAPWPSALATQQSCDPTFDGRLAAELRVGGHLNQECPLSITDRQVSGSCEDITVGIVRPVVIAWLHEPPGGLSPVPPPAPVAYYVSFADLNKDSLEGGQETVEVDFVDDGANGAYITSEDEINAIAVPAPDGATELEKALAWLVQYGRANDPFLDRDEDTCKNLTEACSGVLFDPDHNTLLNGDPCP